MAENVNKIIFFEGLMMRAKRDGKLIISEITMQIIIKWFLESKFYHLKTVSDIHQKLGTFS